MRVRVESVTKVYPGPAGGRLVALDDVSLDVGDGELVTILGPSIVLAAEGEDTRKGMGR